MRRSSERCRTAAAAESTISDRLPPVTSVVETAVARSTRSGLPVRSAMRARASAVATPWARSAASSANSERVGSGIASPAVETALRKVMPPRRLEATSGRTSPRSSETRLRPAALRDLSTSQGAQAASARTANVAAGETESMTHTSAARARSPSQSDENSCQLMPTPAPSTARRIASAAADALWPASRSGALLSSSTLIALLVAAKAAASSAAAAARATVSALSTLIASTTRRRSRRPRSRGARGGSRSGARPGAARCWSPRRT